MRRLKYVGGGDAEPGLSWTYITDPIGLDKLESIEFRRVNNVRHIDNFLLRCASLMFIDLSPFLRHGPVPVAYLHRPEPHHPHIVQNQRGGSAILDRKFTLVSPYFLYSCSSLNTIDLTPFTNITTLGQTFMCGCSSLTSIDLKPLSNVVTVGDHFMTHCTALTSIDLSPLGNVTSIGASFMVGCTSLTSVDLTPLVNMKTLHRSFMQQCKAFTPEVRAQFMQSVKDRKANDAAARKVVVKAGGKKKK